MMYYDEQEKKLLTLEQIQRRGLDSENRSTLRLCGIYPVEDAVIEYNKDIQSTTPDGIPQRNTEGTAYVQRYAPVPLPLYMAKSHLKKNVTSKRWEVETGGVTLPDGTHILTGIDDQNRIATAIQGMADSGITEVDFKTESGWVRLTREQLVNVAAVIAQHVQGCFSRERELHEAIDNASSVSELAQRDLYTGWPGQASADAQVA